MVQGLSVNKPRIYVLQESFPKLISIVKPFYTVYALQTSSIYFNLFYFFV